VGRQPVGRLRLRPSRLAEPSRRTDQRRPAPQGGERQHQRRNHRGWSGRLPAALETHKPSVVVIELGANDGLRGLPVKAMAANLQAMIDASRKAGAQVLLVGMRMPPNYGPDYTARFEAAFAISPKPTACAWCPS
jgi:hypothetical protein